jgi:diacylglycerol kinase
MISENILARLSEAHENISRLNPIVCRIIINTLNAAFIERVIDMIMDSYHEHEEHC